MTPSLLGAVLAGGRSRRMGKDKAGLSLGQESFLEHSCHVLQSLSLPICISVRSLPVPFALPQDIPVLSDVTPESGPIGGLITLLTYAQEHGYEAVLCLACDLPLLSVTLVQRLLQAYSERPPSTLVTCLTSPLGQSQRLIAIWQTESLPLLKQAFAAGSYALGKAIPAGAWHFCPCPQTQEWQLLNVNSPEDFQLAQDLLCSHHVKTVQNTSNNAPQTDASKKAIQSKTPQE